MLRVLLLLMLVPLVSQAMAKERSEWETDILDGGAIVSEPTSGKSWVAHRLFWFTWYSFHPDTLLRKGIIDE
jgi:hypothetical protein